MSGILVPAHRVAPARALHALSWAQTDLPKPLDLLAVLGVVPVDGIFLPVVHVDLLHPAQHQLGTGDTQQGTDRALCLRSGLHLAQAPALRCLARIPPIQRDVLLPMDPTASAVPSSAEPMAQSMSRVTTCHFTSTSYPRCQLTSSSFSSK